jgi:hypothetical protein
MAYSSNINDESFVRSHWIIISHLDLNYPAMYVYLGADDIDAYAQTRNSSYLASAQVYFRKAIDLGNAYSYRGFSDIDRLRQDWESEFNNLTIYYEHGGVQIGNLADMYMRDDLPFLEKDEKAQELFEEGERRGEGYSARRLASLFLQRDAERY